MTRTLTRVGNRIGVGLYRASNGRLADPRKEVRVLLITVPGRRTGRARSTCVRFLEAGSGMVVWGTGSGSQQDPDWFRNLRAARLADVQVGADRFRVRARELVGEERDAMWRGTILVRAPEVARYARKAGREIPVAVLERLDRAVP